MKYLSLFSGIGAFEKALKNIGVEYELVGFSEIDKYAIKSYCAVHGVSEELNLGDISKIDLDELKKLGEIDLITHGSPCQDFSVAGLQAGGDKGSGTRSSLMWYTVDIVEAVKPKYVVWENVKNLLSKKNRHNFDGYLEVMDKLGYNNYYKVLNAKDYGIPQNRERVFTISIRKDIDKKNFIFPEKEKLKLRLKDMLEDEVDEKYYLKDYQIENIKRSNFIASQRRIQEKDYCDTLCARDWKDPKCVQVGTLDIKGHDCVKRVYSGEGLAPTLTDMQGGNRQPKILEGQSGLIQPIDRDYKEHGTKRETHIEFKDDDCSHALRTCVIPVTAVAMRGRYTEDGKTEQKIEISDREIANSITTVQKDSMIGEPLKIKNATKKGYDEAYEGDSINLAYPDSTTRRGRVGHQVSQTLQCNDSMGVVENIKQRKDIKQAERYCKYCGKQLERKRYNGVLEDFTVFKKRKYCNRECMKRVFLKIGENEQTYSNAHTTARKINELILHKEVCELCGSETNLDIHHIDGNWRNNNLNNLMCLCRSCHTKYERNKDKIGDDEPMDIRLRIRKLTPKECWRL